MSGYVLVGLDVLGELFAHGREHHFRVAMGLPEAARIVGVEMDGEHRFRAIVEGAGDGEIAVTLASTDCPEPGPEPGDEIHFERGRGPVDPRGGSTGAAPWEWWSRAHAGHACEADRPELAIAFGNAAGWADDELGRALRVLERNARAAIRLLAEDRKPPP